MNLISRVLVMLLVLVSFTDVFSQRSSIKVLAEVPIQFGLGYEGRLSNRFSVNLSTGLLTDPNSTIIVNVLKAMGTDEEIVLMIDHAFQFGVIGEVGVHYNFGRNYVGTFFQGILLKGGDTPTALVEEYFGEDITKYPLKRNKTQSTEKTLHLKSTLYQAGLLYGRRFPLKNPHLEIDAEFEISADVGSKSSLSSDDRDLSKLSAETDDELRYYYSHYAFVPSLTIAFAYKFLGR
jgi:hypothetical protein